MEIRSLNSGAENVKVDYDRKCQCPPGKRRTRMVNYSMMWHEADIICDNCDGGFVRYWDAG